MNKFVIAFSAIFLALLISVSAEAQRKFKYKDIYEVILTGDKESSYTQLLAFQKQDPHFANTYFQLALIAKFWAQQYDPLTDFPMVEFFIYNTKLYLGLAKLKMLDESGRNREYYENAGIVPKKKKIQTEDILAFLDSNLVEIKNYEQNVTLISNYFNKSVEYYNNCVIIYKQVNADYNNIKDIYLGSEPELAEKLLKIKNDFDSTLLFFKNFSTAIVKYPILNYHQKYELKTIETYRLDGLTHSNFLKNEIVLWNYATWVNEINKIKSSQISANSKEISKINKIVVENLRMVADGNYSDERKPFSLDEKFIYRIEKYDNSSMLTELFRLNEALINFTIGTKSNYNNPSIDKIPFFKRARYFHDLVSKKKSVDSLNHIFEQKITSENIRKYTEFYQNNYSGRTGLKEYSFRQKINTESLMNIAYQNLQTFLFFDLKYKLSDTISVADKSLVSALTVLKPKTSFLKPKIGYITDVVENENKTKLNVGYYIEQNSQISAFVANSDSLGNITKIRSQKTNSNSSDKAVAACSFAGGYYVLLNSNEASQSKNVILVLDKSGNEIKRIKLEINEFPRLMKYDEINDNILCVFGGTNENDQNNITIMNLNALDQSIVFQSKIAIKGQVFEVLKMDKNFFVFCNFTSYQLAEGGEIRSQAGNADSQTNIALFVFDGTGNLMQNTPYLSTQSYFGLKALKLSSNKINILGLKGEYLPGNLSELKNKPLFYSIVDAKATELFVNWHD